MIGGGRPGPFVRRFRGVRIHLGIGVGVETREGRVYLGGGRNGGNGGVGRKGDSGKGIRARRILSARIKTGADSSWIRSYIHGSKRRERKRRKRGKRGAYLDGTAHGSGEEKRDLWLPQSFGSGTNGNLFNFLLIWKLWESGNSYCNGDWTSIVQ
jgi:hypothetical protein